MRKLIRKGVRAGGLFSRSGDHSNLRAPLADSFPVRKRPRRRFRDVKILLFALVVLLLTFFLTYTWVLPLLSKALAELSDAGRNERDEMREKFRRQQTLFGHDSETRYCEHGGSKDEEGGQTPSFSSPLALLTNWLSGLFPSQRDVTAGGKNRILQRLPRSALMLPSVTWNATVRDRADLLNMYAKQREAAARDSTPRIYLCVLYDDGAMRLETFTNVTQLQRHPVFAHFEEYVRRKNDVWYVEQDVVAGMKGGRLLGPAARASLPQWQPLAFKDNEECKSSITAALGEGVLPSWDDDETASIPGRKRLRRSLLISRKRTLKNAPTHAEAQYYEIDWMYERYRECKETAMRTSGSSNNNNSCKQTNELPLWIASAITRFGRGGVGNGKQTGPLVHAGYRQQEQNRLPIANPSPPMRQCPRQYLTVRLGGYGRHHNQVQELLNGLAFARRTNRTFILPPFLFYDRSNSRRRVAATELYDFSSLVMAAENNGWKSSRDNELGDSRETSPRSQSHYDYRRYCITTWEQVKETLLDEDVNAFTNTKKRLPRSLLHFSLPSGGEEEVSFAEESSSRCKEADQRGAVVCANPSAFLDGERILSSPQQAAAARAERAAATARVPSHVIFHDLSAVVREAAKNGASGEIRVVDKKVVQQLQSLMPPVCSSLMTVRSSAVLYYPKEAVLACFKELETFYRANDDENDEVATTGTVDGGEEKTGVRLLVLSSRVAFDMRSCAAETAFLLARLRPTALFAELMHAYAQSHLLPAGGSAGLRPGMFPHAPPLSIEGLHLRGREGTCEEEADTIGETQMGLATLPLRYFDRSRESPAAGVTARSGGGGGGGWGGGYRLSQHSPVASQGRLEPAPSVVQVPNVVLAPASVRAAVRTCHRLYDRALLRRLSLDGGGRAVLAGDSDAAAAPAAANSAAAGQPEQRVGQRRRFPPLFVAADHEASRLLWMMSESTTENGKSPVQHRGYQRFHLTKHTYHTLYSRVFNHASGRRLLAFEAPQPLASPQLDEARRLIGALQLEIIPLVVDFFVLSHAARFSGNALSSLTQNVALRRAGLAALQGHEPFTLAEGKWSFDTELLMSTLILRREVV